MNGHRGNFGLMGSPFPPIAFVRSPARFRCLAVLGLAFVWNITTAFPGYALSDQELNEIQGGFEARRDAVLQSQIDNPYPGPDHYAWHRLDFALAALYRNQRVEDANSTLTQLCAYFQDQITNNPQAFYSPVGEFHWRAQLFMRIYEFFHDDSDWFPGRLTSSTRTAMLDVIWRYAKRQSEISETEIAQSQTWHIEASENHDAMMDMACWGAAKILREEAPYNTYLYDDGHTAEDHYTSWTAYLSEYLAERGRKGLLIEIDSPTYAKYTMQCWYYYNDFAEDALMKRRAKNLLDLYWAVWAQQQIDAVHGGSRARSYQGNYSRLARGVCYSLAWFYMNVGENKPRHPAFMGPATSTYRLPLVVLDMALDAQGRGVYEARLRCMGLAQPGYDAGTQYRLRTDAGGIVRYTYCTPDFILGTSLLEARPKTDWVNISSQNRWHGAIFRGHPNARIYPQCEGLGNGKTYNQQWSVQSKGTLIAQKLETGKQAGDMRVWFSTPGLSNRVEEKGWVFVEAEGAYTAVRSVSGGHSWDPPVSGENGSWMRCGNAWSPVIVEVSRKGDFPDYTAFRDAVASLPLTLEQNVLTYTGLGNNRFTFYTDYSHSPKVNGVPVDYAPPRGYDSPFIQGDWNSGVVVVSKGERRMVLRFNDDAVRFDSNTSTWESYR